MEVFRIISLKYYAISIFIIFEKNYRLNLTYVIEGVDVKSYSRITSTYAHEKYNVSAKLMQCYVPF